LQEFWKSNSFSIRNAINNFLWHELELYRKAMFTLDGVSGPLVVTNGIATVLGRKFKHFSEHRSRVHKEFWSTWYWKQMPKMYDTETALTVTFTMFSFSILKSKLLEDFNRIQSVTHWPFILGRDGFGGLVVRMLASGSRVRGFKPSACLPPEGKLNNLSHVPTLRHVKEPSNCDKLRIVSKIPSIKSSLLR
jgi:hypothetical protein